MTGPELKVLRKKLGLSLAQASKQCEVSVSTWCRWESGEQSHDHPKRGIPLGAVKLFKMVNKIKP